MIPHYQSSQIIESTISDFSFSSFPILFSHITDSHINRFEPKRVEQLENAFELADKLGTKFSVITGDIVDNAGAKSDFILSYGNQQEIDFYDYKMLVNRSQYRTFLDIPGNHDEFGLSGIDSPNHFFLNASKFFNVTYIANRDKFWVSSTVIEGFTIIYMNPFEWPTPHSKLGFWMNPSTYYLDLLETELSKTALASKKMIISHFPIQTWFNFHKSTSGKTFQDLIEGSNVDLILTGHLHPQYPQVYHHKGILEVVGPDLKHKNRFGLVSNDNGHISYHTIDNNSPPKAIVTYPISCNQLSKTSSFHNTTIPIRLVVFSNETQQIDISGDFVGNFLNKTRISDDIWLYDTSATFNEGKHKLSFGGWYSGEVEFTIGHSSTIPKEKKYGYPNLLMSLVIIFVVFFLFDLYLILQWTKYTIPEEEWIEGGFSNPNKFLFIFCGFIMVKARLNKMPFILKIIFILSFIFPLLLPVSIFKVDETRSALWIWGFISGTTYKFDLFGYFFGTIYYAFVFLPILLLGSSLVVSYPMKPVNWIDVGIGSFGFIVCIITVLTLTTSFAEPKLGALSPIFVFIPLVQYISIIIWRLTHKPQSADSEYFMGLV